MRKKILTLFLLISLPALAWQTIESPNFLLHYPRGEDALAGEVLVRAEEIHRLLAPFYRNLPREKTELVLNTQTDLFNGSATPFPQNRIVLDLATIPAPGGISDEISYLLIHEYTHILQLDQNRGKATMVRDLFGKAPNYLTLPGAFAPLWFVEGYAVYHESKHTTGGRAGSAEYRALMRAEIEAERFYTPDQLEGYFERDTWPSLRNYAYVYGAEFVSYLVDIYGEERLETLVWELGEVHLDFNLSFAKVYGNSLASVWQAWRNSIALPPGQEQNLLTKSGGKTIWPQVGRDGTIFYTTAEGAYVPSIRTINAQGRDRQLVYGYLDSRAMPSPDGTALVYAKVEFADPDSLYTDLYRYDLKRGREIRLTTGQRATDPTFAPDGSIYYIQREGQATSLIRLGARGQEIILPAKSGLRYAQPAPSPDGKQVALIVWREGGFQDLALLDLATGRLTYLTEDRAVERAPAWWGSWLLYASDLTGIEQIYATDSKGRHFQLTNFALGAGYPAPIGQELIYVALSGKGYDLAAMSLNQKQWLQVERSKESYRQPPTPRASFAPLPYNPILSARPRWWWPKAELSWDVFTEGLVMENFRGLETGGSDALGTFSWSLGGLWEFYPTFAAGAAVSLYKKSDFLELGLGAQVLSNGEVAYNLSAQYPLSVQLGKQLYLIGQTGQENEGGETSLGLAWALASGRNRRHDLLRGSLALGQLQQEGSQSPLYRGSLSWQGRYLDGVRLVLGGEGSSSQLPDYFTLPIRGFEEDRGAKLVKMRGLLERNLLVFQKGHYLPVDSLKGRIYVDYGATWNLEPQWRQTYGGELGLGTGLGELVLGVAFPRGGERQIYLELKGF